MGGRGLLVSFDGNRRPALLGREWGGDKVQDAEKIGSDGISWEAATLVFGRIVPGAQALDSQT